MPFIFEGWGFQIHLDGLFFVLCIVMVLDYIMGFLIAWKDHNIKSRKMHEGFVRKIGYLSLVIAVNVAADVLIKEGNVIRDGVIIGLLWNEFVSFMEHLKVLNIKVPKALEKFMDHLATKSGNSQDKN